MPKDGSSTRNNILDAAQATIYARGFTAATLDKVLEGAGVTKGAFFHHFKSKDDLIRGLLEWLVSREFDAVEHLREAEGPARRRVLEFVALTIADFERMRPLMPLFYEFFAMGLRQNTIRDVLDVFVRDVQAHGGVDREQAVKAGRVIPVAVR